MASTFLTGRQWCFGRPLSTSTLASASVSSTSQLSGRRLESQAVRAVSVKCFSRGGRSVPPALPERDGLGGAFSHVDRLGFMQGFGQQRKQNWCSDGERSRLQTVAAAQRERSFSGKGDEQTDPASQNISLPLIGEIPLTRGELAMFTPMKLVVWVVLATLLYTVWRIIASLTFLNPKVLMYSTWILIKWPWPAAILVGIATVVTAFRSSKRQPKEWEQVLLLLGSLMWLILVPNGIYSGFVDGWPLVLFALYSGFFVISAVVRYRLYGDLASKDEDKQWETYPSRVWQIGFVVCVVLGHWLAAFEAPFLVHTWNLEWRTLAAIATLGLAVVTQYTAAYFLGKYFDRLVRPQAVVMFGPYRFVRHPIYASYMLLFAGYCLALRAYGTLVFLTTACVLYYEQRTKLEEGMLVDFFGQLYESYREKVKRKYLPLIY